MNRQRMVWLLAMASWAGAWGCGASTDFESGFAPGWLWDQGSSAKAVLEKLRGQSVPADTAAAVGITGHGLVGRALPSGPIWTYEGEVNVLPSLVGNIVGFSGDDKITVLDVTTGEVRYSLPSGGRRLEGLGYDGKYTVLLTVDEDDARPDLVSIVSEHGQLRHSATTLEHVGTPAALGGYGFVPWSHQYVSVFDLKTGENVGRILVRDATNRVEADGDRLLFFGQGVVPLSTRLTDDPGLTSARLPTIKLPGEPSWPVDGSKPRPPRAQGVGLYAKPIATGETASFAHGAFAATYFDIALGFDSKNADVIWATHFERSVVGADASRDDLGVCLEDGSLWSVALLSGQKQPLGSLENHLRACVLHTAKPGSAQTRSGSLEAQILETINGTGPSMAALHVVLVDDLAKRSGDAATEALLAIAQDPLTSVPVVDRASRALTGRSQGADAMIRALVDSAPRHDAPPTPQPPAGKPDAGKPPASKPPVEKPPASKPPVVKPPATPALPPAPTEHPPVDGDRRSTRRPPPLSALAQALANMGEKRAASPLALHLLTPALASDAALAIISALDTLGGSEQCPMVLEFFMTYRAAGGEPEFVTALARAGLFVATHGSEAEKTVVKEAATDTLTHPDLRKELSGLLERKAPSAVRPAAP